MNQIALGDSDGWTILDGHGAAPPFRRATVFFAFSLEPTVREQIEIQIAGTPAQISDALNVLEKVILRARAYEHGEYSSPQMLRFQPQPDMGYSYAPIGEVYLETNPDAYLTHPRGSILLTLHYARPNYFDGDQVELPLTGRSGEDVLGGYDLVNHTDADPTHGNTVLVKAKDAVTDLPAPLRIELENTHSPGLLKDVYFGIYHHPTVKAEDAFFANSPDLVGGSPFAHPDAIQGHYRRKTWTASDWTTLFTYPISLTDVNDLDGRTYRPIVHFFNSHAYADLRLRVRLMKGSFVLQTCEPSYAHPDYGYALFPPLQLPPNQILRETLPHSVDVNIEGLKEDGAATTLEVDQILFLPLDYGASFMGFYPMAEDDRLIDDNFRRLSNVRYSAGGSETIAHTRLGGRLLLYPGENTRLFVIMANASNRIDIMRTAKLRLYYRPRVRIL